MLLVLFSFIAINNNINMTDQTYKQRVEIQTLSHVVGGRTSGCSPVAKTEAGKWMFYRKISETRGVTLSTVARICKLPAAQHTHGKCGRKIVLTSPIRKQLVERSLSLAVTI